MRKHFVVLQHGSHGRRSDLSVITQILLKTLASRGVHGTATAATAPSAPKDDAVEATAAESVRVWDSDVIELLKSDRGTLKCTEMVAEVLLPDLRAWVDTQPPDAECCLHVIGHSFGGIVLRDLLARIDRDDALQAGVSAGRLRYHTFCTIASPHLGVDDMNPVMKFFGRLIGHAYSETYKDLFLMNDVLSSHLLSDAHLEVLKKFERRILYANTRDHLVPFGSSSLMAGMRDAVVASQPVVGAEYPHILMPIDPEAYGKAHGPGQGTVCPQVLDIQRRMFGCGQWTVYPVHIPEWLSVPHNDVVAKFTSKFIDAPQHIAATIAHGIAPPSAE